MIIAQETIQYNHGTRNEGSETICRKEGTNTQWIPVRFLILSIARSFEVGCNVGLLKHVLHQQLARYRNDLIQPGGIASIKLEAIS